MSVQEIKNIRLVRRKKRVRKRVFGTAERPRLTVYRSLQNIYAQIVNDETGDTLCQASTRDQELRGSGYGGNCKAATAVGNLLAQRAKAKGVSKLAFDRNGRRYHGRIKALAEAVREGGLEL